ncbi:segregation/condensation protein A [Candidatus Woesearchaeota archaeon]|nr:segregation/condensation protein A [Candidatus Woesearchaeota archaeon]
MTPEAIPHETKSTQDAVFEIVFEKDELNWKELIYDLVRAEGMNPWDIDVSLLAKKFLETLNKLKETDFRVGGKMLLTSSLLLKIKSDKLLLDDIAGLDSLINGPALEDDFLEEDGFEFEQTDINQFLNDQRQIVPRTPQPRERKVSVYDLVDALEAALETDIRRQRTLSQVRIEEDEPSAPVRVFDLTVSMNSIQHSLKKLLTKSKSTIPFESLLPSQEKQDVVFTFLPLLHLENQRKINLNQEFHFGPIEVEIFNRKLLDIEFKKSE